MITFGLLLAAASAAPCDLSAITSDRAAHDAFARRAIEIVTLAAAGSPDNDRLNALVEPAAPFSLGAGDAGSPLGAGVTGAIALARGMKADSYRFLSWDYMAGPADACATGEIEVEFFDTPHKIVSKVRFSFENGRLVSADGWQRTYLAGTLGKPSDSQP